MKIYELDVRLSGQGIEIYKSEKNPDQFNSMSDFIRQAIFVKSEITETDNEEYYDDSPIAQNEKELLDFRGDY